VCVFVGVFMCLCVFVGVFVFMCVFVCKFGCVFMCMFMFVCINARMPDFPASDQPRTGMIKTNSTGTDPVPDQADAVQHFLVRYRTEIMDAGMPMPALVSSMPMPSYGTTVQYKYMYGIHFTVDGHNNWMLVYSSVRVRHD
jgi:hypothetical protein